MRLAKEGSNQQRPYNLSKLMLHILRNTKQEKRAVFAQDINKDKEMWEDDDKLEDYRSEIRETMWESIKSSASKGADIGGDIGAMLGGSFGRAVGSAIGGFAGAVGGFVSSLFGW